MPEHSNDPLERALRSLAGSAAQAAHGPAASEIRSRGTRRHRRRVAAIAALSTAAVIAVGSLAVGAGRDLGSGPVPPATQETAASDSPSPDNEPTEPTRTNPPGTSDPTAPVEQDPLTEANLPSGAALPGFNDITGWETSATFPGDGQSPISVCQRSTLAGLGATRVWTREYEETIDLPPGTTADPEAVPGHTNISIAQFADEAAALEAYEQLKRWVQTCLAGDRTRTRDTVKWPAEDETGEAAAGVGETYLLFYPTDPPKPDIGVIDTQAVGIFGRRVVLIAQTSQGQDYIYPDAPEPIAGALSVALEHLAADAG